MERCGLYSSDLKKGPVADYCEYGNEPSSFHKPGGGEGNFLTT